jgi:hypothetical protein
VCTEIPASRGGSASKSNADKYHDRAFNYSSHVSSPLTNYQSPAELKIAGPDMPRLLASPSGQQPSFASLSLDRRLPAYSVEKLVAEAAIVVAFFSMRDF